LSRGPGVKVATVERTLVDCIDRPDLAGGISDLIDILQRARTRAKIERIIEYLPTYSSKSLIKKVGFLLEQFNYPLSEPQTKKLLEMSTGVKAYLFSPTSPGATSRFQYSNKWNLIINADGFIRADQAKEASA
jgi:predicted transcriptional regulator of viral defense system